MRSRGCWTRPKDDELSGIRDGKFSRRDACGKATATQLIVQLEKMVNNLANSAPRPGYKRPCSYELFLFCSTRQGTRDFAWN